jgi:Domain of unknown function (DUF1918)
MIAHVGDRLVLNPIPLGDTGPVGVITGIRQDDGAPPYVVDWLNDGRTTMIYPSEEAHVESADPAPAPSKVDQ